MSQELRKWNIVEGKKNILGYERVSTTFQKNEKTIEQQDYALDGFEKKNEKEINIAYIYKDDGISGKKNREEREDYFNLINDLHTHPLKDKIHGIVSTSLDRLGRDAFELQAFEKEIKELKKKIILLDLNIDTDTKEGKLIFGVMSNVVDYIASGISERMWNARVIKRELAEKGLIEYREGRKPIEVPKSIKEKMINWYSVNKLGFSQISKLLQTEPLIIKLKEKYAKEKKTLKCSSGWVRNKLDDWNVEFRSSKHRKKGKQLDYEKIKQENLRK
jgi:DNA invertase Pin-like site-specific DNA recombinase